MRGNVVIWGNDVHVQAITYPTGDHSRRKHQSFIITIIIIIGLLKLMCRGHAAKFYMTDKYENTKYTK